MNMKDEYTRMLINESDQIINQEVERMKNSVSGEVNITSETHVHSLSCALFTYYNGKDESTRELALMTMKGLVEDYCIEHMTTGVVH